MSAGHSHPHSHSPAHSHSHSHSGLQSRYREVRKVTLIGAVVDLLLGVAKLVVGWIAGSQALVADGVHSFSDLATDAIVLYAAKHSHREADEDHPYGHGRIETIATVVLGSSLILVAVGIAYDSIQRIGAPELLFSPGLMALSVALVSVVSKEAIYHYTMGVARKIRSNLLMANAWHSRSDAISSIVVVIGVGGSMMGYPFLDAVAAIVVAVMIAKIGFELVRSSTRELIDTALEPEVIDALRKEIFLVDGVRAVHMLRSRRSGSAALIDVHIQVDPKVSVSEGHQIGDTVRRQIISCNEEITDVTVHIDPEDDEVQSSCEQLPLREELLKKLKAQWIEFEDIEYDRMTLHYLGGEVRIELALPMRAASDHVAYSEMAANLKVLALKLPEVTSVRIYFYPKAP